jgi:hypothetical protein
MTDAAYPAAVLAGRPDPRIRANILTVLLTSVAGGHGGFRRTCSREGVGAAQRVGQPVPAGHAPDQPRRVGCGHPGGGDEQRAYRGSAQDRHRVGSGAEPGGGHPAHRDAGLGVRMRTRAGSAARVQVGVAAGHQQAQPAQIVQDRAQRREFAQVELARLVGRYLGYYRGAFGQHMREGGIGGQDGCRPAPPVLR